VEIPDGRSRRLVDILQAYRPLSVDEAADVARLQMMLASTLDPWMRVSPLHVTGSALVVHPSTRRVLLRWHARQQGWLQVGGHADPAESDPFHVACREAAEETGLTDLVAWPDPQQPRVMQIVVVPVPAGKGEPPHQHGDIRYALATAQPEGVVAESAEAPLAWLSMDEALSRVGEDNLRVCLRRVAALLGD
jgi:8-oxo-dGTP pyrophosphatase MutT (NUDIX family)